MIYAIAALSICSVLLGGWIAIRMKDHLHLLLGFSAGSVVGVALFGLLPEAMEMNNEHTFLLIGAGFITYLIIDRFFSIHSHGDDECHNPGHDGRFGVVALCLHCLIDGISIGLSFKISGMMGLTVSVAILAHQFSDGINTSSMLIRNDVNRRSVLWGLAMMAISPTIGIIIGSSCLIDQSMFTYIIPVFIGTFLYIGASDLLPESHHGHPTIWTTICTILGMSMIYIITSAMRGI